MSLDMGSTSRSYKPIKSKKKKLIIYTHTTFFYSLCFYNGAVDWQADFLSLPCFDNTAASALEVAGGSFVFACRCFSPPGLTGGVMRMGLCLHHLEGDCNEWLRHSELRPGVTAYFQQGLFIYKFISVGKRRRKDRKGVHLCVCADAIETRYLHTMYKKRVTFFSSHCLTLNQFEHFLF